MSSIAPTQAMIDRLAIQHTLYFTGYIFFVVLAALFTWLLWRSGNCLQDAIREDAYARIEVAQTQAKQANERAANAHLLAKQLEHDNLVLKTQLVTIQERLADRHLRGCLETKPLYEKRLCHIQGKAKNGLTG